MVANQKQNESLGRDSNEWQEALKQMIIEKAKEVIQNEYHLSEELQNLHEPLEEWQHAHFRNLSIILDISLTTVKRLFSVYESTPSQTRLSGNTEAKLKLFLECEDLDEAIQAYTQDKNS